MGSTGGPCNVHMMDCASTQRLISFARYSQFLHSQVKCRAFYSSLVTLPTLLIARVVNSELPRLRTTAISFTTVARLEVTEPRARLLKHSPTRQLACAEGSSLQCETVDSLTQTEGRTSKLAQRPGEHGQSFSGICNANLTVGRNWCRCTTPQQRGIHYLMEHPKAERGKHSLPLWPTVKIPRSGFPVIGRRVMLIATKEPRVDPRLLAGSRNFRKRCHPPALRRVTRWETLAGQILRRNSCQRRTLICP